MSTKTEGHHQRFGYLQKPDLHHCFADFWANSNNKMKKIACVYFIYLHRWICRFTKRGNRGNKCNLSPKSHFIMQIWKRNNQQWLDLNENGLNIASEFHFTFTSAHLSTSFPTDHCALIIWQYLKEQQEMQTNCFGACLSSANNILDVVCCAKHARDLLFVASTKWSCNQRYCCTQKQLSW